MFNPSGGAAIWGSRLRAALTVLQSLPERSVLVATEATDMVGPVRRALAQHPNTTQIVACGGDGTVAACAAALDGREIPIAIVPTGTTNVLAYELGLPSNAVRAAKLLGGATRPIPFRTWSANGRMMLLQLGVGFDGLLIWRTPRRIKRALGFLGVVFSALRQGVTFDYPLMRVTWELEEGATRSVVVTSAMVANAKRWAGPQLLVPTADPSDDVVDVLLLQYRNFPELALFWFAILLPGAPHLRLKFVEHVRMRRLRIEALGRPVEAHLDGEPSLMTPLDVRPLGRVHLLAPPLSPDA
ncbi:MAG: diacylglycerol kinase family protein [Gemmatimonadaceae bacterium]